ncbi:MAG: alpha/beta hydrolase [Verrucomicrobiales bacterium]|jgi:pimeloyl-ACP methyl ester carboxylesterase|nr:alpha/beta hydrolase [Verrucomicrobiales bacterium]MBP9222933.1 alpha/beta hydrolase [Verrucomicrobiales bacterium]HQZ27342.1 alpha/beta hydrolase [Verrucomicrobiales bacterium]
MPHVEANGIQIYYEERGSGDPLVLIMGITATGDVWEAHAAEWSSGFRCIMADNRGVGQTDKPPGDYSSAMMADDYAGLMDALGIEKARIVGVSMGSIIAQQLCLRHPEKVQSAVLMCPWAKVDRYAASVFDHMAVCKAHLDNEQFMEWIQLLIFTKPFWDNDEAYEGLVSGRKDFDTNPRPQPLHGLRGQVAACVNHDVLADLGKIAAPCFVLGGKDDIFTPSWMGQQVAAGIPNCDSHFYDGAGHAFHWEVLADFNPRVFEWLKSH